MLPRIDQLVDSTSGFEMLSFMNAYAGYNKIMLDVADEEHTTFTTDRGVYYYKRMSFGLKNTGSSYQRLMNKMFTKLLGIIMDVYVDNMLVKSLTAEKHVENWEAKGKFLGHVISRQGIETNLEKVQAILDMEVPNFRNDVQSLTGKMAALTRLVSRLMDKCTPFFQLLKSQHFRLINWGPEQKKAFKKIKEYLS